VDKKHLAAVTDPKEFGKLLRTMDAYDASPIVSAALRLAPLVFVRPAELQRARWQDVDFEAAEWRYLVTKTKTDHIVPLATQAVKILQTIRPMTGKSEWVFPSPRTFLRPITNVTVLGAMRRLGITKDEACVHGFRATARTLLDEVLGFPPHLIEHQLAHTVKDALGRAYNRTKHLPERKAMMQKWADYLDELKKRKD
jgi:integrase